MDTRMTVSASTKEELWPALPFKEVGEFLLPYDDIRQMDNPQQALLDFFNSVYEAGVMLGQWDRASLARQTQ